MIASSSDWIWLTFLSCNRLFLTFLIAIERCMHTYRAKLDVFIYMQVITIHMLLPLSHFFCTRMIKKHWANDNGISLRRFTVNYTHVWCPWSFNCVFVGKVSLSAWWWWCYICLNVWRNSVSLNPAFLMLNLVFLLLQKNLYRCYYKGDYMDKIY
jgi:hypothetical protein